LLLQLPRRHCRRAADRSTRVPCWRERDRPQWMKRARPGRPRPDRNMSFNTPDIRRDMSQTS